MVVVIPVEGLEGNIAGIVNDFAGLKNSAEARL
jgi:hypothetical protein